MSHFTSTYARIILSDWKALAKMMTGRDEPSLSAADIETALSGPLGDFFRQKMAAYAKIMRDSNRLAKSNEEVLKAFVEAKHPIKSAGEIESALSELTTLTEQHYQECLDAWRQFSEALVKALAQKNTILNKIEVEDLRRQESLSELFKRFKDLNLELPRIKSKSMTLETYLYFKTYLALQSALSRQHLPHQPSDIEAVLKAIKKEFQAISEAEKALLKKQADLL